MVTQQVVGAARLKLMIPSLVDISLLPLPPQSDFFQLCLLQRKSRDPSAHKNSDCTEFRKPLWAGWGPCCNSIQLLVLFLSSFFFFTFKALEGLAFPSSQNGKINLLAKEFEDLNQQCPLPHPFLASVSPSVK